MKRGLLLIDRGSKEREAEEELELICKRIKERSDYVFVHHCFLEVVPPNIDDGIEKCLKYDIDELTIVPYFLYPGRKVKAAVTEVMRYQSKTKVRFVVTKPMSMHNTMIELVDNRIISSLNKNKIDFSKEKTDVLIIGHGSKDPNAKLSLDYVVNGLRNRYRNVERCFLEIEEPDISAGIKKCEENNPEILIVVFYFLHEGAHVKTDINMDLKPAIENSKLKRVFTTEHIGTDEKMINLIIERAHEVEHAN